jgi:hypothetical protein
VAQSAAKVAGGVAQLKASGKDNGQRGPGNNAELPESRNGPGQRPTGNGNTHSALNYLWL